MTWQHATACELNTIPVSRISTIYFRVNEEGMVLVGDFGLTRDVYSTEYYRSGGNAKLPVKWMSPETLNDGISNEKTDVVSFKHSQSPFS